MCSPFLLSFANFSLCFSFVSLFLYLFVLFGCLKTETVTVTATATVAFAILYEEMYTYFRSKASKFYVLYIRWLNDINHNALSYIYFLFCVDRIFFHIYIYFLKYYSWLAFDLSNCFWNFSSLLCFCWLTQKISLICVLKT